MKLSLKVVMFCVLFIISGLVLATMKSEEPISTVCVQYRLINLDSNEIIGPICKAEMEKALRETGFRFWCFTNDETKQQITTYINEQFRSVLVVLDAADYPVACGDY